MPHGQISSHKTRTGITLTKVLKSELEYLAKQDHRSLNNYMEMVLTDHVEQQRKEGKLPDQLIAENDNIINRKD